jgi:hypothetical protein
VNNEYSPPPQIREKIKTMVVYYWATYNSKSQMGYLYILWPMG